MGRSKVTEELLEAVEAVGCPVTGIALELSVLELLKAYHQIDYIFEVLLTCVFRKL